MFIKELELYGFKSFANRERFVFDEGIVAIVGPNGCGKSNVVEAIKFALGESNPNNLRVRTLPEVIFSGSKAKQALNLAEVSLLINNEDKVLPCELSQIKITRRIFRSGESQFFINDIPCRLKDITNLLVGTGVFKNAYSLIEQQTVDIILSNSDNYLLFLFNEASGITKYKILKEESLAKLNLVDQNMLRLQDIISYTQTEVENLYKQYKDYQTYKKLMHTKQSLEFCLMKDRYYKLNNLYKLILSKEEELKAEKAKLQAQIKKIQSELLKDNQTLTSLEIVLEDFLKRVRTVDLEIFELKEKLMKTSYELEKLKENKQRLNLLKEKIKELQNNLGLNQKKLESIKLKLQTLMNNKNEIEKELHIIKKKHLEAYNDYLLHKKRMIKNNKLESLIELKRDTYKEAVFAGLSQYQDAIIVDTLESAKQLLQKNSTCGSIIIVKELVKDLPSLKEEDTKPSILKEINIKDKDFEFVLPKILEVNTITENLDNIKELTKFVTKDGIIYKQGVIITQEKPSSLKEKEAIYKDYKHKEEILQNKLFSLTKKIKEQEELMNKLKGYIYKDEKLKSSYEQQLQNILKHKKTPNREEKLEENIQNLKIRLNQLETQKKREEEEYTKQREKSQILRNNLKTKEISLKEKNNLVLEIEKKLHKLSLKKNELIQQIEGNKGWLQAQDQLPQEFNQRLEPTKINQIRERILEINSALENLGSINPLSERDYEEKFKKFRFLTDQYKDMILVKNRIKGLLEHLDKEKEVIFKEAFSKINSNFSKVYKELFGGGTANLVLSCKDGDYKIEIFAKPQGKSLKNINLLSGGERTLTVISLLFGIYLYKTSPFCIIDEVDAPLDEANTERFTKLLKTLSKNAQFIIITHNKKTIEVADVLYGITMEEPGISKLVSVKLKRE